MHTTRRIFGYWLFFFIAATAGAQQAAVTSTAKGTVWTNEQANKWYAQYKWLTGTNYIPANSINQLEMWQAETFDSAQINKEFGWAENLGFNTMRVFLHSLAWKEDKSGFKKRMQTFLNIADRHGIKPMFVFFDDCWNKVPKPGQQPQPKPGIHNSGWMQDPGQPMSADPTLYPMLEQYVKDVLTTFGKDNRILMWDLYNEPGNSGKGDSSLLLLSKIFEWARAVNPSQPLTAGVWHWGLDKLNQFQITHSDIITYHNYEDSIMHQRVIDLLQMQGKPLVCTEYMARSRNSTFSNTMPLLKKEKVGAINWGFVAGKTNTIYAWDSPVPDGSEPAVWFHDILRKDGTAYKKDEVNLIRALNEVKQ